MLERSKPDGGCGDPRCKITRAVRRPAGSVLRRKPRPRRL